VSKTSASAKPPAAAHPHLGHLHIIEVLSQRTKRRATRDEAFRELDRYRDQGLIIQKGKGMAKKKQTRSDLQAQQATTFSGQGIMFAIIDDREQMQAGHTTIDVIADAIEAALDRGHETSEDIARYLTTSAFQHIPDKRVRFNSVLKAGDTVGAQITRKLYNAYNELAQLAEDEADPVQKKLIQAEATGFAEALNVVLSPFSCEDPGDPRLVDWDEVDRITAAFEKEQRFVRKERKGNPQ
jgi:hypothetical protein